MQPGQIDNLKFTIDRFDHYYESVNSKTNLYITLNTFVISAVSAASQNLLAQLGNSFWAKFLIVSIIVVASISLIYTIWSSIPYLRSDNDSVFYFGYVSRLSLKDLLSKLETSTTESITRDLGQQLHALAQGLENKFRKLRVAGVLLLIKFILITFLSVLFITK